jgi:hypothetical protein
MYGGFVPSFLEQGTTKGKYAKKVENYPNKCHYILSPKPSPAPRNITQKWKIYAML